VKVAVYPGSFDPITLGHLDVIKRAAGLFDRLVVGVAAREEKRPLFMLAERIELTRAVCAQLPNVAVDGFDTLLADFARKHRADAVVRGMRAVMDFDYEFQMALTNRKLSSDVETVFFLPSEKYFYLSSSLVREVAAKGGELCCFVPEPVVAALQRKFPQSR